MINDAIDGYERVPVQQAKQASLFLFVCHTVEANHLQIGFGMESRSGLQKSHIAGPLIHEFHTLAFADWLRLKGRIYLTGEKLPRLHPFTSSMGIDLPALLDVADAMPLSADRFMPFIIDELVDRAVTERFAEAIERVHIKCWGHPRDWDVQHVELNDGRFVWMAYDSDIDKIRVGLGFHSETNDKQYGLHTYAISLREVAEFSAFHFHYLDAPLQFMGQPPRWPSQLSHFLVGEPKQRFTGTFLKLADEVWPGAVDPA